MTHDVVKLEGYTIAEVQEGEAPAISYRLDRRGLSGLTVLGFIPANLNAPSVEEQAELAYLFAAAHELKAAATTVCVSYFAGINSEQMERAITGLARAVLESDVPEGEAEGEASGGGW